jgi:hypothetical protein
MKTITHTSFVYKWTHLPTGKWYIGSRTAKGCHPEDGYISSSLIIKPLIKQNPTEWEREIIKTGTPEEMVILETTLLKSLDAKNDLMSFNQHNGDGKFTRTGVVVPLETRMKQSEAVKGDKHPNKGKPSPNKGKVASEETRRKQSEAKEGKKRKPFTDQTIEKMKTAAYARAEAKGYVPCPEDLKEYFREKYTGQKKKQYTCPHCGKVGGGGSMTRWHFDNCKHKGN